MSKKQAYFAIAEKMFVEEHLPISGITDRIGVTEKTLRKWRDEGDWENKKLQLLKSQQSCHAELYRLVEKLVSKMTDDLEKGDMPDGSTFYFVKGMIDKLPKLKAYEEATKEQQEAKLSTEEIASKVDELLGVI